jgi:hypothetical protein
MDALSVDEVAERYWSKEGRPEARRKTGKCADRKSRNSRNSSKISEKPSKNLLKPRSETHFGNEVAAGEMRVRDVSDGRKRRNGGNIE